MFLPISAHAGWTGLTCVNPSDNFNVAVEFDEKSGLVRYMGGPIVKATFTPSTITFTTLPPHSYFHNINRSNGVMMIRSEETGGQIQPHQCTIARKKF